jgi:transposase
LPAVCLETRQVRASMEAQRNKTDAADALGIAHLMRTGLVPPSPYQDRRLISVRLLLSQRRNLKRKFLDLENTIRHSLKAFGKGSDLVKSWGLSWPKPNNYLPLERSE